MKQEAVEVDMEFFSKHVGPYFTWLESKIESGWEQSDSVQKDILKEVRYVSTNMRARFILGVSRDDFAKEAARTLDLLELAAEAFPAESDEIETKIKFFSRAIANELGENMLPAKYRGMKNDVVVKPTMMTVETPTSAVKTEPLKIEVKIPVAPKIPVVAVKPPVVKTAAPKVEKPTPAVKPKTEMKKMVEKKTAVEKKATIVKKPVVAKKPSAKPVAKQTPKKNGKERKPLVQWSKVKAWVLENLPKRF